MRRLWVLLHRWFGLFIALFLIVSGLTGAVISWDHELDAWLNPQFFDNQSQGDSLPPLKLVDIVEHDDPRVRVSQFPVAYEPGHNAQIWVDARVDPSTGRRYALDYDHVFVNPVTGEIAGKRLWGKVSLRPEHLMSFLYKLHYSLQIPAWRGIDSWGVWLMGIVALVWLVDSFVAFVLTLPPKTRAPSTKSGWQRWKPSWKLRTGKGGYKLNFDLHRAGGLWVWGVIIVIAFTSFSLNLYREVFYPLLSQVSQTTPGPFETRTPTPLNEPVEPTLSWAQLLDKGRAEAARRGWQQPVGDVFYADNFAIMGLRFFAPGTSDDGGGMSVRDLYYDGRDGRLLGDEVPWQGTAADVFVQLQFPLHSGRILGTTGRIMMSIMGLVVAMLSMTGLYIWWKKRRARQLSAGMRRRLAHELSASAPPPDAAG